MSHSRLAVRLRTLSLLALLLFAYGSASSQDAGSIYEAIRSFELTGGKAELSSTVFKRDRVEMTLTGTIYFTAPVEGRVTGAVFIGQGNFRAAVPDLPFEKTNVKRLLGVDDLIESDFKTAVFRFTDNTFDIIGKNKTDGAAPPEAQTLASELGDRILKETGANLSSRLTQSIVNSEVPGVFFANYDGGKRSRFSYLYDPQTRIPSATFGINAGEKGLIFRYDSSSFDNEIWLAFHSLADLARGAAPYSDANDLVDITHYDMDLDLRQPTKLLSLKTKISMQSKVPGVRAVNFTIGENLGEIDNSRLKNQLRVKEVRFGGSRVRAVQEDWESGLTIFFDQPLEVGKSVDVDFELAGDFLRQPDAFPECSYPRSNGSWYPRHGFLDRSTFSIRYTHAKKYKIASTGTRLGETPIDGEPQSMLTKYEIKQPIPFATFALGPFERHSQVIKWENGNPPTTLEYNSLPGDKLQLNEKYYLNELNNAIRNFQFMFGDYPYETFSAVYHPYSFGQGFATLLTIPKSENGGGWENYTFLAHETSHQWWGNIVSWRSYRDQWLSEGFADYSGILYEGLKQGPKEADHTISLYRKTLTLPPDTATGLGKGRLVDVGPLILGQRLETRKTYGAYSALVYRKGALVLRMIHYLLTDPGTGNGDEFFAMMKDFVDRYRNKVASTEDFAAVASEHFAKSPLGRKYGLRDLNWFFAQWVYETTLPSYHLTYQLQDQPDGTCVFSGTVEQSGAPGTWFMPLPVAIKFGPKEMAYGALAAHGPSTPFSIKLPKRPQTVELDPDKWILSEKTSTN